MFVFFLMILTVGRIIFIIVLSEYIGGDTTAADVFTALWFGLRLSCQTTGILTLIILLSMFLDKILSIIRQSYTHQMISKVVSFAIFLSMSILYIASFPFYKQFHSNFNQMIFNAANEDLYALLITLIDGFNLPLRLLLALLLAIVLYKLFQFITKKFLIQPSAFFIKVFLGVLTYAVVNLTIFGGGLTWQTELNFENIGVTKDKFLNESILDSYQAIYRGYVLQNRITTSGGLNFTSDDIKNLAAQRAGQSPDSDNLDDYLINRAKGALIPKPKHIFIIISEAYANWTLLDKYTDLHIADGVKSIINSEDSDYCPTFLPNGANTVSAVTGIVTNFADANLYLTTLSQSFNTVYSTSAAPQFKKLGYVTNFYYAGPSTWEKIGDFTTAQGFDNFYSQGDIASTNNNITGNVWGVDDKFLYQFIENKIELSTPSFNVILNTSNHAPYTVDLEAEGITLTKKFDDEELNHKLAHHAYADRELKNFVDFIKSNVPESLIIIVGDHADRCNIDAQPSDYERFGVPFIITGNGIYHGILNKKSAGSHIDVVPTIIELIAPKDFNYYAIGTSLTENICGVNYALFITCTAIGNANIIPLQPQPLINDTAIEQQDWSSITDYINYVRGVSYWRAKFGNNLNIKN